MAKAGTLEGNPVREDLEEAAGICGVDFLLNVVLDEHKNVIHAVAGEHKEAHRQGCRFLDEFYRMEINELADIVDCIPGRGSKGSEPVSDTEGPGQCGAGGTSGRHHHSGGRLSGRIRGAVFEQWMLEAEDLDSILKRIQRDFQIGGHKAASLCQSVKTGQDISGVQALTGNWCAIFSWSLLTMCRRHMTRRQRRWDRGQGDCDALRRFHFAGTVRRREWRNRWEEGLADRNVNRQGI